MRAFDEFLTYKKRIPVRGAIMLNHEMDSVVLVKGWKKGANWSFPRGKINREEDDLVCAIREVYEETGFDLEASGLVPEDREVKHITLPIRDQHMSLYVFRDVPMDTYFEPRTRKEISKIQWWRISDLPGFRRKGQHNPTVSANANKFYMVAPFLKDLRKWIIEQKKLDTKRNSSHQYLSTGMSHDGFMTEEDLGADSTQEPTFAGKSTPGIDTLAGATIALKNLLKVQPPTQGLQADAIKSPVARDSGPELLALLQGKPRAPVQPGLSNAPPHTPMDHIIDQAPQPRTPHQQHPRPPHFSTLPPPPVFSVQQTSGSFSYQGPNQHTNHPSNPAMRLQNQMHGQQITRAQQHPHSYQSQHLIHPQPLPPHVQKALFTGGPAHAPIMPQPVQQDYAPHPNPPVPSTGLDPQFPNIHAPMVPTVRKQSPPKLTSHSLALLNAFKSQDQAGAASDLPLRRYAQEPKTTSALPPQELPAEMERQRTREMQRAGPVDLLSMFKAKDSPAPAFNHVATAPTLNPASQPSRHPISEAHKSTLLDLFKSPNASSAVPARPGATALPTTATPSAVELSAVEPHTSKAAPISTLADNAGRGSHKERSPSIPELHPEANLPFRAMSILSRPPQEIKKNDSPRNGVDRKTQVTANNHMEQSVSREGSAVSSKPSPEKPFQPQILKRPQPNVSEAPEPPRPTASPLSFVPMPVQPSFDRGPSQTTDHKQTLLALFGKVQSSANPSTKSSTDDVLSPLPALDPKPPIGNLTSGELPIRRSSQAPMSLADKSFLLSYLDNVAKGTRR